MFSRVFLPLKWDPTASNCPAFASLARCACKFMRTGLGDAVFSFRDSTHLEHVQCTLRCSLEVEEGIYDITEIVIFRFGNLKRQHRRKICVKFLYSNDTLQVYE